MNIKFPFIIIDDSELDCYVTRKFLELSSQSLTINTFYDAREALEVIRENSCAPGLPTAIILLDLQMPFMNGFNFMEEFEKLPAEVQKNYRIAILTVLSSSTNPADAYRIKTYKTISGVIEKPLTREKLSVLLDRVNRDI